MISALVRLSKLLNFNQRKSFLFIIFLMIIFSILEMFSIGLLIPIFSITLGNEAEINNFFSNFILNFFQEFDQQTTLIALFFVFFIIFLIKFIFSFILFLIRNNFAYNIRNDFSKRIFSSYLNKPLGFHIRNNSSKIAINCKYEIDLFTSNILLPSLDMISDLFISIALFTLLLIFDPLITIFVLIFFGLVIFVYQFVLKKRSMIWANERQYYDRLINKVIREGLNSIREIIFNDKINFFVKKLKHYLYRNLVVSVRSQMSTDMPKHFLEFISIVSFILIFFFMTKWSYSVNEVLVLLALFAAVSFKMLPTFNRFMANTQRIRYAFPIIKMLYDELQSQKISQINKKNFSLGSGFKLKNSIQVKNLSFKYPKMSFNVFESASLSIKKGHLTGLCGYSGSGKSTFLNLLSGLETDFSGEVLIDGADLKKKNITWIDQVAYLSQQPFFLDDTIKNNIAYADQNVNDEKINECLKLSQLSDFVNSLENGTETLIGEDGARMSGGQLQRLALARALYKDFNILILDESLNALDNVNEEKILNILSELKKDKIILITSHKKNIIDKCDVKYEIINKKFQKL